MEFKRENYITIPGFAVVDLGLSGNELICYSLIFGFTQDAETEFRGSLSYLASALNVTKQNAKKIIDRLIDRGLIEKREMYFSGVKFCHYVANRHGVAETVTGCYQNSNGGVIETVTHKDNAKDKTIDNTNISEEGLFNDPETVVVTRPRRTTESLCLFENSRYYDFDIFAKEFPGPEFKDVDLAYYYHAVADWSAQGGKKKRDWIATARNFMRSDMNANKLHRLTEPGIDPDYKRYLEMGMEDIR